MSSDQTEPFAVSKREAARLQGLGEQRPGDRRSGVRSIDHQIKRGELVAVKDGVRTLVTMASIRQRQASLPRVKPAK